MLFWNQADGDGMASFNLWLWNVFEGICLQGWGNFRRLKWGSFQCRLTSGMVLDYLFRTAC